MATLELHPHAIDICVSEGGAWISLAHHYETIFANEMPKDGTGTRTHSMKGVKFHALRFSNGSIWDTVNGWRPTENNVPLGNVVKLADQPRIRMDAESKWHAREHFIGAWLIEHASPESMGQFSETTIDNAFKKALSMYDREVR